MPQPLPSRNRNGTNCPNWGRPPPPQKEYGKLGLTAKAPPPPYSMVGGKMGKPIAHAHIQMELPGFDPKAPPEWAKDFSEFLLLTGQSHVDVETKYSLLKRSCKKKYPHK